MIENMYEEKIMSDETKRKLTELSNLVRLGTRLMCFLGCANREQWLCRTCAHVPFRTPPALVLLPEDQVHLRHGQKAIPQDQFSGRPCDDYLQEMARKLVASK